MGNFFSSQLYMELYHCYKIGLISATMGSLSLLSTIFLFFIYIFNKSLRSFSSRMVIYLQFSDFLLSLSIILIAYENFETEISKSYCQSQAFLMQYGVLSASVWSLLITLVMLLSLSCNIEILEKYEKYYLITGYVAPFIVTFM